MYTLGGGIDTERGWGRTDETWHAKEELAAYGVEPTWFGLGRPRPRHPPGAHPDARGRLPALAVTEALCRRWQPGVRLLPMTDDRVETHVVDRRRRPSRRGSGRCTSRSTGCGCTPRSRPAPWCRSASSRPPPVPASSRPSPDADVVLVPPSNPVVSVGTILGVPGVRDALRATAAPVVGLSPVVAGSHVRGMAAQLLTAIGVEVSAAGGRRALRRPQRRRRARRLAGRHRRRRGRRAGPGRGHRLRRGAADDDRPRRHGRDGRGGARPGRGGPRVSHAGRRPTAALPARRRHRRGRRGRRPRRRCSPAPWRWRTATSWWSPARW